MTNHILKLPDERDLSYCLYGPGDGQPVLYFHGTPSSPLEPSLLNAYGLDVEVLLYKYKLQLIAIDRPGMGLSTFNPAGDFISFAKDVKLLIQFLKISQCKVLCWSGGGPFALEIANRYQDVITGVYIITGFTLSFSEEIFRKMHGNKMYFGSAKYFPRITRFILNVATRIQARKPIPRIISRLPLSDHSLMTNAERLKRLSATTLQEACHLGSKGAVYEAQLYFKNYGYDLQNIKQPIHFWWGDEDNVVIRLHPEAIKQSPQHQLHYKKGEGHLSLYIHYFEEVLQTIAGQ